MKKKTFCSKEKTEIKIPTGSEFDFAISFINEKEEPVFEEKKKEIDIEEKAKNTLHKFDMIQLKGSFPQRSFKKEKNVKNEKKLHFVNFGSSEQKFAMRGSYIGTETKKPQKKKCFNSMKKLDFNLLEKSMLNQHQR